MSEQHPNQPAIQAAITAMASVTVEPTSLVSYQSNGKLLALGSQTLLQGCNALPAEVKWEAVLIDDQAVEIKGFLGAFTLTLTDKFDQVTTHTADAILDLHQSPLLKVELLPPGYFHSADGQFSAELTEDLQNLTGEFQKPKYFDYDSSICAHSVHGKIACQNCIEACPAEAIISVAGKIEVNPNLCQGGGSCATVCPSGAIRYRYPTIRDQGKRVQEMLKAFREHAIESSVESPVVLFHTEGHSPEIDNPNAQSLLPVAVEELASVGMDLCLSALAFGAGQVVLLVDDSVPQRSVHSLTQHLSWLQTVLIALNLDPNRVSCCDSGSTLPVIASDLEWIPMEQSVPRGKREAILLALDHLVAQLKPAALEVELPAPAPFGEAIINAEKCTLCLACIGACPGRALQDGSNREVPEVFFIENHCLQCGACVQTCPEDAITIRPRMLLDREQRIRSKVLNQDTPFACISCGKPFAPTSVIHKMQEKLKGHHMFDNDRALDRLKMCEDCRVVDVMQDPQAMGGQFNPLKNFDQ